MLEHTLHRVCTTYVNEAANAAADRVAINAIVNEAADATADRINADSTIVDEAADAKADRVAVNATSSMKWHTPWLVEFPPSPMWQGVSSEHEQIITAVATLPPQIVGTKRMRTLPPRTPEGGRICTFCPELRATVPIGVGNDGSIDPFPLDDPSSSKPRFIGSDRDELS